MAYKGLENRRYFVLKINLIMRQILLACVFAGFGSMAMAQSDFESEIDFYQSAYGLEKKAIVENFMQLKGDKANTFWPIYDQYEAARREIGKNRIAHLNQYIKVYETITDEQADDVTRKMLANRATQEKLYKKYFGKLKKSHGAKTALQFLELEVYLQTAISFALLESIPFVGE